MCRIGLGGGHLSLKDVKDMRILIIEDDNSIAQFLRTSFEDQCFAVDVASDGDKGGFLARTNEYDLIILDNVLPGKGGQEICLDIRKQGKSTPILVLSAVSETDAKVSLLNTGADDYLTKPFSLDELLARVKALLRRPRQLHKENVQIENMVLDPQRQSVTRGKKEVRLTRTEFMLLEYLMKNSGSIISRAMIMEHVR